MNFNLTSNLDKNTVFENVASALEYEGFIITNRDQTRPWGGFFVIDENQAIPFAIKFFPQLQLGEIQVTNKLSPKILVVAAKQRLSWQYHFRRSEIWKVIFGKVGVKTSLTDKEGPMWVLAEGTFVKMEKGDRHRLIGLDGWGIVAEIWQHTDITNPSDEDDIVRLQDDFGR